MNYVESGVKVGKNVTLEPYCVVKGETVLEDGCTVGSFSVIENSVIGRNSVIKSSRITDSAVGANCAVGPNAHLRDKTAVGDNCRVGNFVEIKNSILGEGTKASHLAYIGDATVGKSCNIGCGVIFCNYDGKRKHRSVLGDNVFVGSNCNLIAPITLGDGTFVASGTTLTKNTAADDFVIGRAREEIKPNRAKEYLNKK